MVTSSSFARASACSIAILFAACGSPHPDPQCREDADCPGSQRCVSEICEGPPRADGGGDASSDRPDGGQPDPVDASPSADAGLPEDAGPGCEQPEFHGDAPPLATLGECGRLTYGRYANQGQTEAVHRLPDFSHAGYRGGGVALPTALVAVTLTSTSGDQRARIQEAIDSVSALPRGADGLRGAVFLRSGTYRVGGPLRIEASGVVLRGEGQGTDGTVLVATLREQHDLIAIRGAGSGLGEVADSRAEITSAFVPVGSTTFEVASAAGFSVGDTVGVLRTPNQTWLDELTMTQWGWTTSAYTIAHERSIAAVEGNAITVDIPIVDTMEARYGGGAVFRAEMPGRVEQVGVEDLRLVSEYEGPTDEEHGWIGVRLHRATHSWVRRVTVEHFGYAAVSIHNQSSFNSIEDCAMLEPVSQITGARRYSFNVSGGVGNLFQRCYSEESRHDFVTGARVTGPHVWLDCYSTRSHSDDGPHHRWATGLLFDNVHSRFLHVENRQSSGTGHGWSGAQVLFWNGVAQGIRNHAPRGAMNWTVGSVGEMRLGGWAPDEPLGHWESHNRRVEPRSLYLQQLRDRLGTEAVEAVTLPAQREGRIWAALAGWAGEGRLEDASPVASDPSCATGIASGQACCASACGSCGGSGCGGRPGGAAACCASTIYESGRSCDVSLPPCAM